jgi:hypothetical protein
MKAYAELKAAMRAAGESLTSPELRGSGIPARVAAGESPCDADREDERHPHIEDWMEEAFAALVQAGEEGAPFALVPCFMNGKPAAVIAAVRPQGRKLHVMPLFLACQPWMKFSGVQVGSFGKEPDG